MAFGTGDHVFAVDVGSVPLLALNALASALAMILGKSMLLPMDDGVVDTSSQTSDAPLYRIWDAWTLTVLTSIVGCYSTLLIRRSYTNIYQFCCLFLAITCIGSTASLWAAYGILDFTERQEHRSPVLLDQDYVPQLPLEIVLSMDQEPIDEVGKLINNLRSMPTLSDAHVTVYIKDTEANNSHVRQRTGADYVITLPNVGREGETFLNHILSKWDSLARRTIFLQAGIHNQREFYTHVQNYYNGSTGFLNLGWSSGVCDSENYSDRLSWRDNLHFLPQLHNQMYNSTRCGNILLSYKGQFIVSAARIRGINEDIYSGLSQAFIDKESWAHQPSYLQGRPDSMSAPDFGYAMEILWNMLFQCSGVDVAWKYPSLVSGWRIGGDISDCQCFDT